MGPRRALKRGTNLSAMIRMTILSSDSRRSALKSLSVRIARPHRRGMKGLSALIDRVRRWLLLDCAITGHGIGNDSDEDGGGEQG